MAAAVLLAAAARYLESAAVVLCFCGLLRIGEALTQPKSAMIWGDASVVLLLRRTKIGEHRKVELTNAAVLRVLRELGRRVPVAHAFCHTSYAVFHRVFSAAMAALGAEQVGFHSHSMRRGGAAALFRLGLPLSSTMFHGLLRAPAECTSSQGRRR